ncbi:unnamed protein product [Cuscuta epithymum]|uniref:Uncharacterized protein n=1 Tax=Cuscuta epithymum TaxID=186058 RepID=A0AAV0FP45_9ASTE|nr:unnamed protein product [Cuscuta epithymum]
MFYNKDVFISKCYFILVEKMGVLQPKAPVFRRFLPVVSHAQKWLFCEFWSLRPRRPKAPLSALWASLNLGHCLWASDAPWAQWAYVGEVGVYGPGVPGPYTPSKLIFDFQIQGAYADQQQTHTSEIHPKLPLIQAYLDVSDSYDPSDDFFFLRRLSRARNRK